MEGLIYLDHAATTRLDERVFAVMKPYYSELFGNPSSIYRFGQLARHAVDSAREKTADILKCKPREILFTSCGTESNNLFVLGVAEAYMKMGGHIVALTIEHDSILKPLQHLEAKGFSVTYVAVQEDGIVNVSDVERAIRADTIMVTVMYANNEIGTIQPIAEIGKMIRQRRKASGKAVPIFHTDACQAANFLDLSVDNLNVDAMTLNGGKIYGPKGSGMLYLKEGVNLVPQLWGGGQERRLRSGTEDVPAIVGFAEALFLAQKSREEETKRLIPMRDALIKGLLKIPETRLNGDSQERLPNNVNISFRGLEGESILLQLDMIDVAASSGSACTSGSLDPSHVIRALNLDDEWTHSSTRFTLGHGNTQKDIDFIIEKMPGIIKELRETSPFL